MTFLRSFISVLFIFVFIQQPAFSAKPDRNGGGKKDSSDTNEICDRYGNLKGWAKKNHTQDECSEIPPNTAPTIVITSPEYGFSAEYGTQISFAATAVDNESGDLSSIVVWRSSIDGQIPSTAVLSVGTHTISARVSDREGLADTDTITVTVTEATSVNTAPSVVITSPMTGTSVEEGYTFLFQASAMDNEDGDLSQNVSWVSSVDGSISSAATLSEGNHTITASVVDAGGLTASDSINVSVTTPEPVNTAPSITITAPVSGTTVEEGNAVIFVASAEDGEGRDLSSIVVWRSSIDGQIPSTAVLSVGTHTISARVSDREGLADTDTITVTVTEATSVNTAPSIVITSPMTGTSVEEGYTFLFQASAMDNEDGDLSQNVSWVSSVDGSISSAATLSEGNHTITASVVDAGGITASDSINVSVTTPEPVNTAPSITITAPVSGTTVEEGNAVIFVASAEDGEGRDLSSIVVWRSSIDGQIPSTAVLSVGTHTISARVSDREGLADTDTITVTVTEATSVNTAPSIVITSPMTGTSVEEGYSFLFQASAMDSEDGDLSNSVTWTSSLDGQIANLTTLSVGNHVITASVRDSKGLVAEDSLQVSVTALDVITKSVQVNWNTPLYRDNGAPLAMDEIAGFEITLVSVSTGETLTIDVPDGYATSLVTEPVALDEYTLKMRTYDVSGSYSEYTDPVIVIVDNL